MAHLDFSKQHAFIIVGAKDQSLSQLTDLLSHEGLPTRGHPDFLLHEAISFGVDDARDVQFFVSEKSTGGKKIVIIASTFFHGHAQNTLLKTIEEPTVDACIFFITDSSIRLLPTVRSRAVVHTLDTTQPFIEEAKMLLSKTKPERLVWITSFIELYHDEENQNHVREAVHALLSTCIQTYHQICTNKNAKPLTEEDARIFEQLTDIHTFILDNGSPVKMLTEAFLLLLPPYSETKK